MNRRNKRLLGDTVEEVLRNNGVFLKASCFTCGNSPIRRMNAGSLLDTDMIVWELSKETVSQAEPERLKTLVLRAKEVSGG